MRPLENESAQGTGTSANNLMNTEASHNLVAGDEDEIVLIGSEVESASGFSSVLDRIDSITAAIPASPFSPAHIETQACRFFVSTDTWCQDSASLGFIGSANTTLLECRMNATHLFSYCDGILDVIYHPRLSRRSGTSAFTEAVLLLRRSWDEFFDSSSDITSLNTSEAFSTESRAPGAFRMQFCVGEGVNVVRAALEGYQHAQRIFVVAFAPSCLIRSDACFSVRHYRAANDCVSMIHERGGSYPETAVVERSATSRGYIDNRDYSSTFQDWVSLEALCFQLRERLRIAGALPANFDLEVQELRDRCLDSKQILGPIVQQRGLETHHAVNRDHAILRRTRRELIMRFITGYQQECVLNSGDNLPELSLDEYPRDRRERVLRNINFLRDACMIPANIILSIASGYSDFMLVSVGVPLCHVVSILQRIGVYVIRRDPDGNRTLLRQASLRLHLLDYISYLYQVGAFSGLIISGYHPPAFVVTGVGGYLIITGTQLITEMITRLYSPLRGRIESSLTEVEIEDIVTDRATDASAQRLGLIRRVFRGAIQVSSGLAGLIVAASTLYPLLAPVFSSLDEPDSNHTAEFGVNNTTMTAETAADLSGGSIAQMALVGFTGLVSAATIVGNIVQVRRMMRRLRGDNRIETPVPNAPSVSFNGMRRSLYLPANNDEHWGGEDDNSEEGAL